MDEPKPEYIDISKLRPGPIQHESLPPELLERIKAVFDVVGRYFGGTLESFAWFRPFSNGCL